jgi:hypothetical protein
MGAFLMRLCPWLPRRLPPQQYIVLSFPLVGSGSCETSLVTDVALEKICPLDCQQFTLACLAEEMIPKQLISTSLVRGKLVGIPKLLFIFSRW